MGIQWDLDGISIHYPGLKSIQLNGTHLLIVEWVVAHSTRLVTTLTGTPLNQ